MVVPRSLLVHLFFFLKREGMPPAGVPTATQSDATVTDLEAPLSWFET